MRDIEKIYYENLSKLNKIYEQDFILFFEKFLKKGWYVLGDEVSNFETAFSNYCNSKYAIGLASGLDALIISIDAFNFPKGSEIIVPSNTYIATILSIIRNGFKPVLVEPDIKTYNINPEKIEQKINNNTVAILVVHLYGKPCEMDKVLKISKKYDLKIIEDCAQAHGAKFKNKTVGTFGVGCHSFYPTKNLGALGDAGAITCNNKNYYQKIKSLRNYGSNRKYYNNLVGYNSRLDELQAGFLSIKLKYIDKVTKHKRFLASLYFNNLDETIIKPDLNKNFYDVYHIYNIRVKNRDSLRNFLLERGIKTEIHYPVSPSNQRAYKKYFSEKCPVSEEIHKTTISLPISFFHTKKDILKVCNNINHWIINNV